MTLIQKSILSTLAIYDAAFNYPLTGFEVFKYLTNPLHLAEFYFSNQKNKDKKEQFIKIEEVKFGLDTIITNLNSPSLKKFIGEKNGFYFLKDQPGKEKIVEERIERQKISIKKWKEAKKSIFWLQLIPYLRMVMINGSVALDNAHKDSDIDVLIIAKKNRLWTTRFFTTFLLQIIGRRRHGSLIRDRICLNHYISDNELEIKIRCLCDAQLYAHLVPVLEIEKNNVKDKLFEFQKANYWIGNYIFFWPSLSREHPTRKVKYSSILRVIANLGEILLDNKIGDLIERILKYLQKEIIKRNPEVKKGRIKIVDTQLIFHPLSPVKKTLEKYNQIMLNLGLEELAKEKELDFFTVNNNIMAQSSKKGT